MNTDIGPYSLEFVLNNLKDKGYGQEQRDRVRRSWLAFVSAKLRRELEQAGVPDDVVVSMDTARKGK